MVRAKHPDLNWLSESLSLFGSLRPAVDVVDLFSNCNCRIRVKIWLRRRNTRNKINLFPLTTRSAWSLNWPKTLAQKFWKRPRGTRLFGTGWTCGMISRGTKNDHHTRSRRGPVLLNSLHTSNRDPIGVYQFMVHSQSR